MPRNGKACKFNSCRSRSKIHPQKKFHPFIKPWMDRERCLRWISATGRKDLIPEFIDKASYVCEDHFVNGCPSAENPDPMPHNFRDSIVIPTEDLFVKKEDVCDENNRTGNEHSEQHTPERLDQIGCDVSPASSKGNPHQLPNYFQDTVEDAPASPLFISPETHYIKSEGEESPLAQDA